MLKAHYSLSLHEEELRNKTKETLVAAFWSCFISTCDTPAVLEKTNSVSDTIFSTTQSPDQCFFVPTLISKIASERAAEQIRTYTETYSAY